MSVAITSAGCATASGTYDSPTTNVTVYLRNTATGEKTQGTTTVDGKNWSTTFPSVPAGNYTVEANGIPDGAQQASKPFDCKASGG